MLGLGRGGVGACFLLHHPFLFPSITPPHLYVAPQTYEIGIRATPWLVRLQSPCEATGVLLQVRPKPPWVPRRRTCVAITYVCLKGRATVAVFLPCFGVSLCHPSAVAFRPFQCPSPAFLCQQHLFFICFLGIIKNSDGQRPTFPPLF